MNLEQGRQMEQSSAFSVIKPEHPSLSGMRQCELVSISWSSFHYQPMGEAAEHLSLIRLPEARASSEIDAQFLEAPWHGPRQMTRPLRRDGREVGRKLAETQVVSQFEIEPPKSHQNSRPYERHHGMPETYDILCRP